MIAELKPSKPQNRDEIFEERLSYACEKAVAVRLFNVASDWRAAIQVMQFTSRLNERVKRPVEHIILSWSPVESPHHEQMFQAAKMVMSELGASRFQYVAAIHADRPHAHIHIMLNVIDPRAGKALSMSHVRTRLELACRKVERHFGWPQDRGRFNVVMEGDSVRLVPKSAEEWLEIKAARKARGVRKLSEAEIATYVRKGKAPLSYVLSEDIKNKVKLVLSRATAWSELHREFAKIGLVYSAAKTARIAVAEKDWSATLAQMGTPIRHRTLIDRLGIFVKASGEVLAIAKARANGLIAKIKETYLDFGLRLEQIEAPIQKIERQKCTQRQSDPEWAALIERQANERVAIRAILGGKRSMKETVLRRAVAEIHLEEKTNRRVEWRRQVRMQRTQPPTTAVDTIRNWIGMQQLLARRGVKELNDYTSLRQNWILSGAGHSVDVVRPSDGREIFAKRNAAGGIIGFEALDIIDGVLSPVEISGNGQGFVLLGNRNAPSLILVAELRHAREILRKITRDAVLIAVVGDKLNRIVEDQLKVLAGNRLVCFVGDGSVKSGKVEDSLKVILPDLEVIQNSRKPGPSRLETVVVSDKVDVGQNGQKLPEPSEAEGVLDIGREIDDGPRPWGS